MPVTFDTMTLQARLKNGKTITGESNIGTSKTPIVRVFLKEKHVRPNKAVLKALLEADAIIMGPGSLYTSVLPNLLVKEVAETVALARAAKIYVCNVMTQPGETDYYTASDHVKALVDHTAPNFVHYVLANKESIPKRLLRRYAEGQQEPVLCDDKAVEILGPTLVKADLLHSEDYVRHDPDKLGKALIKLLVI
jgi:uncharacterized cofD-like protein